MIDIPAEVYAVGIALILVQVVNIVSNIVLTIRVDILFNRIKEGVINFENEKTTTKTTTKNKRKKAGSCNKSRTVESKTKI